MMLSLPRVSLLAIGCAALAFAASGATAASEKSADVSNNAAATNWSRRSAVNVKLKQRFVAGTTVTARPADLSPLLIHAGPATDVVQLTPLRVNGARMEAELRHAFVVAEKKAHEDAVLRHAGIGTHGVRVGGATAGVLTVFYVPVFAAISWDW